MIYKLENGYRVRATAMGADTVEFETRNPAGEAISTVTLSGDDASEVLTALRVADGLRFGRA